MGLPKLNPIQAPDLICTECAALMRREITVTKSGHLDKILYYCDTETCLYGLSVTKEHQNGQNSKYVAPPEVEEITIYRRMAPAERDAEERLPVPTEGLTEPQLSNEQIDAKTDEMLSLDQSDVVPTGSETTGQPE